MSQHHDPDLHPSSVQSSLEDAEQASLSALAVDSPEGQLDHQVRQYSERLWGFLKRPVCEQQFVLHRCGYIGSPTATLDTFGHFSQIPIWSQPWWGTKPASGDMPAGPLCHHCPQASWSLPKGQAPLEGGLLSHSPEGSLQASPT